MSEKKAPKRDIIADAINAGGATKETLMETAEVNSAGLSSQFTYLRLTGKFPVKDDDGVYSFVSEDEWETMKADAFARRGTVAAKRSPEERQAALEKRYAKLEEAVAKATERAESGDSEILALKATRAQLDLDICDLELQAVVEEQG